jgi:hypothetical protein
MPVLSAGEADFDEFASRQLTIQLGGDRRRRAVPAHLHGVGLDLTQATQAGFLGTIK